MAKVLIGGLTKAHETLLQAFFQFMGQEVIRLPEPDNEAFKIGKMYSNKGQCNPVYYTVGTLIRFLQGLKKSGEQDINSNYFYLTAGACGPCRFGMYEMEYRRALSNAGFEGFRVVAVQQSAELVRELREVGFTFKRRYLPRFLNAIILGDIMNSLFYKAKPYEVDAGSADHWRTRSLDHLSAAFRGHRSLIRAMKEVRSKYRTLRLDFLKPKPRVKIIGEFFSHLQEGDASYRLPAWLVEEGAEPVFEPLSNWLEYLLWGKIQFIRERAFRGRLKALFIIFLIKILQTTVRLNYSFFRFLMDGRPDRLARQRLLAKYASPYYNIKLIGGEGHMEAGKHVYAVRKRQAHMIISIKPFSCMPSTQSDGVQTKIAEDMGGSLFVSIDTTGDAEVNVKSRILMKLHEARRRAEKEFESVIEGKSLTAENLADLRRHPGRRQTRLQFRPKRYVCTAASVIDARTRLASVQRAPTRAPIH
jgi:predicted nucleotide-binding protein (sugar kinase/HSP70/actin superfamily)